MNITVVCVGKCRESFYREAVEEYAKRLSRYCRFRIAEAADESTPERATAHEELLIRKKEAERILRLIRDNDYVIALAIDGKRMDSVRFSEHLGELMNTGNSGITFVIGGSLGLHEQVLERADERLSFSDMTFPHQLMRVILAEQLYRAFRIMNHEPYHK